MSTSDLAEWSNAFVYASMVALTLSMIAFAASFSARGTRGIAATTRTPERTPVAVGVGAGEHPVEASDSGEHAPVVDPRGRRAGNIGLSLAWLALRSSQARG